ncbi:SDR family NAD(P)-dependent oxidoreductase [Microbacterium sp. B2969]|uniref:SDR family NAD(P)-dependent oxidoreductase n=1 Tax=Microbacterium alkaliflavum TaxID=3248839 RepID=A0ABW7QBE3_9MICO
MTTALHGRLVLLSGGTSAVGAVAARTLLDRGARVIVAGRDPDKIAELAEALPRLMTQTCDLTDETSVRGLAERTHSMVGRLDGVLHLVGGWRGGGGLAGQSDDDYRFLERSLTSLRHVTRTFDDDLRASAAGRFAMVSSTAVARPLASGANYAAIKAASEAWTRAVAQGLAKAARDAQKPLAAASVVFRVKALDGLEQTVADAFCDLWDADAASVNDTIVTLEN